MSIQTTPWLFSATAGSVKVRASLQRGLINSFKGHYVNNAIRAFKSRQPI